MRKGSAVLIMVWFRCANVRADSPSKFERLSVIFLSVEAIYCQNQILQQERFSDEKHSMQKVDLQMFGSEGQGYYLSSAESA